MRKIPSFSLAESEFAQPHPATPGFLRLPTELRIMIYDLCSPHDTICSGIYDRYWIEPLLKMCHINRVVRTEALQHYFGTRTIELKYYSYRDLRRFMEAVSPTAWSAVRYVRLVDFMHGFTETEGGDLMWQAYTRQVDLSCIFEKLKTALHIRRLTLEVGAAFQMNLHTIGRDPLVEHLPGLWLECVAVELAHEGNRLKRALSPKLCGMSRPHTRYTLAQHALARRYEAHLKDHLTAEQRALGQTYVTTEGGRPEDVRED